MSKKKCTVSECQGIVVSLGYCQVHYRIVKTYGVNPQEFDDLLRKQNGVCAVCRKIPPNKPLCLDHNHLTNEVRAIICHKCNSALGLCDEDNETLTRLAEYARTDGHSVPTRFNCKIGDFQPLRPGAKRHLEHCIKRVIESKIISHLCEMPNCLQRANRKGLCRSHNSQQKRENRPLCNEEGCHLKSYRKEKCTPHYEESRAISNNIACSEPGCSKLAKVAGICRSHYAIKWRESVKNHPDYKEIKRAESQKWRDNNPEKSRESARNNYRKNKEKKEAL